MRIDNKKRLRIPPYWEQISGWDSLNHGYSTRHLKENFPYLTKVKLPIFWEFTTVAQEGVTYYLSEERISSVTGYIRQKQSIEVGSPDQAALFLSQGDTLISSAGINLQLDLRDDVSWPTKGVFFELDVENANPRLFGDLEYLRTDIITNTYLNIKKLFVFALGLRVTKYFGIERDGASMVTILFLHRKLYSLAALSW